MTTKMQQGMARMMVRLPEEIMDQVRVRAQIKGVRAATYLRIIIMESERARQDHST